MLSRPYYSLLNQETGLRLDFQYLDHKLHQQEKQNYKKTFLFIKLSLIFHSFAFRTYDTFLFEKTKLRNKCCCVRDSIAEVIAFFSATFWTTFWNDAVLARNQGWVLLWFIVICWKKILFPLDVTCILHRFNAKHGRPGHRMSRSMEMYIWVVCAAVYLRDKHRWWFGWSYFAKGWKPL